MHISIPSNHFTDPFINYIIIYALWISTPCSSYVVYFFYMNHRSLHWYQSPTWFDIVGLLPLDLWNFVALSKTVGL